MRVKGIALILVYLLRFYFRKCTLFWSKRGIKSLNSGKIGTVNTRVSKTQNDDSTQIFNKIKTSLNLTNSIQSWIIPDFNK